MWNRWKLALLISAPLAGATPYALADRDVPARPTAAAIPDASDTSNPRGARDASTPAPSVDDPAAREARRAERHRVMLARYDLDHDGTLTLGEFKAGAAKTGHHRHGRSGRWRTHGTGEDRDPHKSTTR